MPRPTKGTPEYELWLAAIEVATDPPTTQAPNTVHALVYWPLIQRLRDALDAVDIDWRAVKAKSGS